MKRRSGVLLALALLVWSACGPKRIIKRPVPPENVVRSYRLTAEGDRLLEEGKDHLAMLKYVEAANLNPYHEVIFNKLGIAYSRLLMYPQAERAVERSVALNPSYPFAYNTLGIIRLAQKDVKGAVRHLRKAIGLSPRIASFHVNLGHSYMQANEFEKARQAYLAALALDPKIFAKREIIQLPYPSQETADPERHYQMARFFAETGDTDTCLAHFGKALAAGFIDAQRLMADKAFGSMLDNEDFVRLAESYGLSVKKP